MRTCRWTRAQQRQDALAAAAQASSFRLMPACQARSSNRPTDFAIAGHGTTHTGPRPTSTPGAGFTCRERARPRTQRRGSLGPRRQNLEEAKSLPTPTPTFTHPPHPTDDTGQAEWRWKEPAAGRVRRGGACPLLTRTCGTSWKGAWVRRSPPPPSSSPLFYILVAMAPCDSNQPTISSSTTTTNHYHRGSHYHRGPARVCRRVLAGGQGRGSDCVLFRHGGAASAAWHR